ncbi:methyltransferase family protein [Kordiimonas sp.]|uniref:methyltransferase family protein n=1 Tax=Kordiimonas sp. TaxID=1970157 RepID=UPI003A8CD7BC
MNEQQQEKPYRIYPPHLFLLTLASMHVLGWLETGQHFAHVYGLLLTVFGVWLAVREKNRFVRAGTTFLPGRESETLVTEGAYKVTRNPMYVAMVLALLGLWPLTGGWSPLAPLIIFIALIQHFYIMREERMLTAKFGKDYLAYKARVRRWI